ncbi:hypothetical protein V2W55_20325, partial [Acinetobacter baumannii]|uniref:hypothetical protein n=1 Tax=Acinetobacter baumannii TaxID=470 RepID=UPI00312CA0D2
VWGLGIGWANRDAETEANAAFIVRAVNGHDAMLAALEAAEEFLADSGFIGSTLDEIRAAIGEVRGAT